ncbi:hypothetical protein V6Z12_A11G208900 [Gossypium hirsutum]
MEKGFNLGESNHSDFMANVQKIVEALNWEAFCDEKPILDLELVREFYANLTSTNAIEALSEINVDTEMLQEFLRELTIPGFKWTVSRCGNHTCRRENLTPLAKIKNYQI